MNKQRRKRGVILTSEGLQNIKDARSKFEYEQNFGQICTYEKLSQITKKRHLGALAGLSVYPNKWLKSPEIANFIDFNRTTLGKGCNELGEIGILDKKIAPGTENQNKPTLLFKLRSDIPIKEVISFLKKKRVYKECVYPELLDKVFLILQSNEEESRVKTICQTFNEAVEKPMIDESVSSDDDFFERSVLIDNNKMHHNQVNPSVQSSHTQTVDSPEKSSDVDLFIEKIEELDRYREEVKRLEQEICDMGKKAGKFISPLWSDQN